jgi:hypothetical protein
LRVVLREARINMGTMFSTLSSTAQAPAVILTHGFAKPADLFDFLTETLTVGLRRRTPQPWG